MGGAKRRVDLSRMAQLPKCAIAIREERNVDDFYYNAKEQFGDLIRWGRRKTRNYWKYYSNQVAFGLMFRNGEWRQIFFHGRSILRRAGYEIIYFEDILASQGVEEVVEVAEIEESQLSIQHLYGGMQWQTT